MCRSLVIRFFVTVLAMAINIQPMRHPGFLCNPARLTKLALRGGCAAAAVNQGVKPGRMSDLVPEPSTKLQPRVIESRLVGDWDSNDHGVMVIDSYDDRDAEIERMRKCQLQEIMQNKVSEVQMSFGGSPLDTDLSTSLSAES
jgi:hypothetical protein